MLGINIEHTEPLLKLCHNKLQRLELFHVSCSKSDAAILSKYNTPALNIGAFCKNADILLPVVFKPSSLESLTIHSDSDSGTIGSHTVSLLKDNSNIKHLTISDTYLIPLAPALRDNTSLVLLEVKFFMNEEANLLTLKAIIQSNRTLQQLEFIYQKEKLGLSQDAIKAMVEIMDAAAYSPSIKEVTCSYLSLRTKKRQHVCKKRSSSAGEHLLYSLENLDEISSTHIQFTELD